MSLPEDVTAATLTVKATKTTPSSPIAVSVSIAPSEDLTHLESEDKLSDMIETLTSGPGVSTFVVPHSSQAGFVDDSEAVVSKWYYIATITSLTPSGSAAYAPLTKLFMLPAGITAIELELLPTHMPSPADTWVALATGPTGPTGATGATGAAGPVVPLDSLTDVNTTGVADNYVLTYDSATSTWKAEPLP